MSFLVQKGSKNAPTRAALPPRVDVLESAQDLLVVADLPGVDKDAVNVQVEDGELTIEARRPTTEPGAVVLRESRAYDFRRAFTLPPGVDAANIEAKLEAGVLTLRLPKVEAAKPRRIAVQAG